MELSSTLKSTSEITVSTLRKADVVRWLRNNYQQRMQVPLLPLLTVQIRKSQSDGFFVDHQLSLSFYAWEFLPMIQTLPLIPIQTPMGKLKDYPEQELLQTPVQT